MTIAQYAYTRQSWPQPLQSIPPLKLEKAEKCQSIQPFHPIYSHPSVNHSKMLVDNIIAGAGLPTISNIQVFWSKAGSHQERFGCCRKGVEDWPVLWLLRMHHPSNRKWHKPFKFWNTPIDLKHPKAMAVAFSGAANAWQPLRWHLGQGLL